MAQRRPRHLPHAGGLRPPRRRARAALDARVAKRSPSASSPRAKRATSRRTAATTPPRTSRASRRRASARSSTCCKHATVSEAPAEHGVVEPGTVVTAIVAGGEEVFLLGNREIAVDSELDVYSEASPLGAAILGLQGRREDLLHRAQRPRDRGRDRQGRDLRRPVAPTGHVDGPCASREPSSVGGPTRRRLKPASSQHRRSTCARCSSPRVSTLTAAASTSLICSP